MTGFATRVRAALFPLALILGIAVFAIALNTFWP